MSFQIRFRAQVQAAVLALAAASFFPVSTAHAGAVELGQLLRSPIGRYLLTGTQEGVILSERILGRALTSESDLRALTAKLASREAAPFAAELESRLSGIQSRLAVEAMEAASSDEIAAMLRRMARESLCLSQSRTRFLTDRAPKASEQAAQAVLAAASNAGPSPAVTPAAPAPKPSTFAIDLSGREIAELKAGGADLCLANLRDTTAMGALLPQARLALADLSRANLRGAVASNADFTGALADRVNLRDANLRNSTWSNAVLTNAQLAGADFSGADLRGADLTGALVQTLGFHNPQEVDVVFRDALFDAHTRLPFSRETAESLGMIYVGE